MFFQNFETHAYADNDNYHTGRQCWHATFDLTFAPPAGKNYVISWFQLSGSKWVYHKEPYDIVNGKHFSYTLYIDDVCVYPEDAQMSTYTYDPVIGLTSGIDARGETVYYEYDGYQRLLNIKDMDGNILKNYTYNLK